MRARTQIEELLRDHVQAHPDNVWLKFKDLQFTWKSALSLATRAANGYVKMGVRPGDAVSILARNRPDFIWSYLGCLMVGGAFVPMNRLQSESILEYMFKDADVSVVAYDEASRHLIKSLRSNCPHLAKFIAFDETKDDERDESFQSFMSLPDQEPDIEVEVAPSVVSIIYTSGTTGVPKGIVQNTFELSTAPLLEALDVNPGDTLYTCNPLFHAGGLYVGVLGTIRRGGILALGEHFSASRFWDDCRRYNAKATHLFSSMFSMLLLQPPRPDDADNPVERVLSVGCPPLAWAEFEERFHVRVVELYAMSDAPGLTVNTDGRTGSAGKPAGGSEFRVVDGGRDVPPGAVGEIVFRHPLGQVTRYHNLPQATAEAYRDGWFHSGDLGRIDEKGDLFFVGRLKEAIRRRGENVSAWEVANVIERHPKVQECAVFGVPSELGEEEVMACVVVKPAVDFRPEELIEFCTSRMAIFAIPRFIDVVESLPKTGTQKIQYLELKSRGRTPTTWDRELAGARVNAAARA
jgi:carnitine-CoA ligase